MALPLPTGGLGLAASLGMLELGGPVGTVPALPALAKTALPYIAKVYSNGWVYKRNLGPLLNAPVLKLTLNAGHQPVTVSVSVGGSATPGDLVVLTEQGGDGSVVYTGLVEDIPEIAIANGSAAHNIMLTPLVVELGDAVMNQFYQSPTDIAQMVRDAVRKTTHLFYDDQSVPNSGVLAVYNFSFATALDVLNQCRLIGGVNMYWRVDAVGRVWFRSTPSGATHTVRLGVDYSDRKQTQSISKLKNYVTVVGGVAPNASAPTNATYNDATSQASYGVRALNPPILLPTVTDQSTINAVAASVGAIFNRVANGVDLNLPSYGTRIQVGQTMRLFEPAVDPLSESQIGTGVYSQNYVVLDVTQTGPQQRVILGDIPISGIADLKFEIDRIVQRMGLLPLSYVPASLNTPGVLAGGSFATAASGARAVYDSTGLHLYDSAGGQRIFMDANNAIETIVDTQNITRTEMGSLVGKGNSPAQYGFRVSGADNVPIFDSLGLMSVMSLLASSTFVAGATYTSLPYVDVTVNEPSQATFKVTRTTNVLVLFRTIAQTSGAAGNFAYTQLACTGQGTVGASLFQKGNGFIGDTDFQLYSLTAGTYTLKMQASVDVGQTLNVNGGGVFIFSMGG